MSREPEIDALRRQIDKLDAELLALVNRRVDLAKTVGEIKTRGNDPVIYRPEREAKILGRIANLNKGPLSTEQIERLFREIISLCRGAEAKPQVATLGPAGTYSELATVQHFGQEIDIVLTPSIEEVFRTTEADAAQYAVVPVENSTEGGIGNTMDRLLSTPLTICGEIDFRVRHCLLGSSQTTKPKYLYAHQQALSQCRLWIDSNLPGVKLHPTASNAEAARLTAGDTNATAIASAEAAEAYGLAILHRNIEDQPGNSTRFLVLGHRPVDQTGEDKTSVAMSVRNQPGALHALLAPLSNNRIDLTKVESRPSRTGLWEYIFFIDFDGHLDDQTVAKTLTEIESHAAMFKVLGSYPKSSGLK